MLPVSGAQVWLKADAGVLNASDLPAFHGEAVKTWQDQSGNANHVTQATAGQRPTFNTNVLNGMPAISFDGGDALQGTYADECGTIYVVGKVANNAALRTWAGGMGPFGDGIGNDAWYFQPYGLSVGNTFIRTTSTGSSSDFRAYLPYATGRAASRPYIQMGRHNGSSIDLGRNGFIKATDTYAGSLMPIAALAVGAGFYNGNLVDRLVGDIHELIIFDRALTDEEDALMHGYLRRWFGGDSFDAAPVVSASWYGDGGGATDENQALYIGTSDDATTYTDKLAAQWIPDGQVVRDPSLIYDPSNGYWWIAYTNKHYSVSSTSFSVMRSKDGRLWDHVFDVSMASVPGAYFTFAPEFYLDDDGLHVIVGVGNASSAFEMYETHPTNATLTTWSAPVKLTGLHTNVVDGMVRKVDGVYQLWHTDRTVGPWQNVLAKADALTGPYTYDPDLSGNWQANPYTVEGPYVMGLGGRIVRLHYDTIGGIGAGKYVESIDGGQTWGPVQSLVRTAKRHGSFINQSFVDPRVTKGRMTLMGVG
ncbi:MAG: hypothetical protein R3C45_21120 [Phycisphaerales bacterium]